MRYLGRRQYEPLTIVPLAQLFGVYVLCSVRMTNIYGKISNRKVLKLW